MKNKNVHFTKRATSFTLASLIFVMTSCASTTLIQSNPSGAKLYLNDVSVGTTPYSHRDTKIVGTTTMVRLEMDGYEPLNTSFSRDEEVDIGACVGGIFVLIPFLWVMKYQPVHNYDLTPANNKVQQPNAHSTTSSQNSQTKSKADRLRELKQLLDENILTQEEYEKEKKKILEEDEK